MLQNHHLLSKDVGLTRVFEGQDRLSEFVAELWRISEHCEHGPSLSDMIRDRLVAGINDENIQKRLLATDYNKWDLHTAMDICIAMESATKNAKDLRTTSSGSSTASNNAVHKISKARFPHNKKQAASSNSQTPSARIQKQTVTPTNYNG